MNHDVLGELHVLEHAFQFAGESSATLWDTSEGLVKNTRSNMLLVQ